MAKRPLKVCYFGTYRANYARNQILIAGLRSAGVEVTECHVPLWRGIEDRVQIASGGWASFRFFRRIISTYWRLWKLYRSLDQDYDVMILGYPGLLDVFLARLFSKLLGIPLVMDMLMSLYLVSVDRHLDDAYPYSIHLLYWLEYIGFRLPDLLISDTENYIEWYCKNYNLSVDKFRLVPIGVDSRVFQHSKSVLNSSSESCFRVVYYGTYIPNHGVNIIVEAAKELKNRPDICFELVGEGPTKAKAVQEATGLPNIHFIDWLNHDALVEKIMQADLILGVFGVTAQSLITIHNKIYQGMAMKKPVLSGDSPAVRKVFKHKKHLYLIERGQPDALVKAICELEADECLRGRMAESGHALYKKYYSLERIGHQFRQHLLELTHAS